MTHARLLATLSAPLLVAAVLTIATPGSASADGEPTYGLNYTAGLGAYPRSEPRYEARTGAALPEGSSISARCYSYGETITNNWDYSSDVWIQSTDGTYWAEAWLETGSNGVPDGLPNCSENSSSDTTDTQPEWQPDCSPDSSYIDGDISVTQEPVGFKISFAPTDAGRFAWRDGYGWEATVDMWHDIQNCVPNLYDDLADSIFQQLECHQRGGEYTKPFVGGYITGPTYDLESRHEPLTNPDTLTYILTKCGNGLLIPQLTIFA